MHPPQEPDEKADFDLPEMPEARRVQVVPEMGTAGTNNGEKTIEDRPCVWSWMNRDPKPSRR